MTTTSYRTAIVNAVKAQLLGKTIAADSKVFTSLDRPLNPATDLPAIIIYTQASRRSGNDYGRTVVPRMVTVTIEGAVLANAGQELIAANALAEQIEDAWEGDLTLGQLVHDSEWQQTVTDVTSHGQKTMGVCLLQYQVEILTRVAPDGEYEFHDDGYTVPPTSVQTVPVIEPPPADFYVQDAPPVTPDPLVACDEDGCNISAWQGEQQPDGTFPGPGTAPVIFDLQGAVQLNGEFTLNGKAGEVPLP